MVFSSDLKNRLTKALASPVAADELQAIIAGTTGNVFYVNSATGADVGTRTGFDKSEPFDTLDYAIGRATASNGDVIVLMPGHAETTTAIALDVAGLKIVGLGFGRNRPTLTCTTAATDLIDVTAANCQLHNIRLVGAASGTTGLVETSSAGTDFEMHNCELVLAATPLKALRFGGARPIVKNLTVNQSANGADYVVTFTAGVDGAIFDGWDVLCPNGLDNGLIESGAFAHEGCVFKNMTVVGLDTLLVDFVSSTAGAPDSLMSQVDAMASAAITSIEDLVAAATSKGLAFSRVYASDATGKRAVQIPLVSAS